MSDPRFPGHDEWDALAVGWALSALHPDDEQRFADHLPGCDRCTATVREALYTAADLAYAVPDEAPPPALKSRLMAAVAAEPRVRDEESEWPLGAPHPGTPGYGGEDWFARPGREVGPGHRAGSADPDEAGWGAPSGPALPPPAESADRPAPPGWGRRADRPDQSGWAGPSGPALPERGGPSGSADRGPALPEWGGPAGSVDRGPALPEWGGPAEVGGARPAEPEWGRPAEPRPGRSGAGRGRHSAGDDDDVVVPFAPRRRRFATVAAAAAVLALVVGLGAWNVRLRADRDQLQQVVAQREAAISQLTANGPATVAALTANGQPSPKRQATLVIRGNQAEVIVESLGATTGEERYWLWTLDCDTAQPSDLRPVRGFTVAQPEFSVRDIGSEPGLGTATCFAISQEIGTATPTAPRRVVAVGKPG